MDPTIIEERENGRKLLLQNAWSNMEVQGSQLET